MSDKLANKDFSPGKISQFVLRADARIDMVNNLLSDTGWSPDGIIGIKTFTRALVIDDILRAEPNSQGERKEVFDQANRVLQTKITGALNDPIEQRYVDYLRAAYSGYIEILSGNQIKPERLEQIRKFLDDAQGSSHAVGGDGKGDKHKREILQLLVTDISNKLDKIK